jgi:nucleotide-binding universal stress UspA family protein
MSEVRHAGPIVVGVDGSPQSVAALEWAAEEALLKEVDLHLVVAWHMPNMLGWPVPLPEGFDPVAPAAAIIDEAQQTIATRYPGLVAKAHVEEGPAARSLMDTARDVGASLLVVGARGHGEVTGLLIGSVSEKVATHAKCPVVIVRH